MSINSFGHLFRFTTWGESHGPALGATVDGCPPGVALEAPMIQQWMDKRRPGLNKNTTQRQEADAVKILSGVFDGVTTGTPIQLMIENTDQRSKDYGDIANTFRPGHADITYHQKYGVRDYRGGGRSSARETASRAAAGGVAREAIKMIAPNVYGKLDTDLAAAMMSINAVKGVEIGEGMAAAALTGRDNADEIFMGADGPEYSSNHAGGVLGGISTGQDIVVRFAVKPTSSILSPRKSIRMDGTPTEVITKGRHDPCVGIRAVPVGEAMMACVILDHLLLDRGQTGGARGVIG